MSDEQNYRQYDRAKEFTYESPQSNDLEKKYNDLLERYNKLQQSYQRLDSNMKTVYMDNKAIRKHVLQLERENKNSKEMLNKMNRDVNRLYRTIEMMLRNDEGGH